ncbi:MAG: transcriptional regulator [Mucilaginibacter sp.]|nr:transcriptional regulator [Mucilaginibacter sp.]
MNVELVTREDLRRLEDLLKEIKQIVQPGQSQSKKWLKSSEVRKMLNISPGTLQNLRINGTLRFTKMGSIMYYKLEDINKVLEENGQ